MVAFCCGYPSFSVSSLVALVNMTYGKFTREKVGGKTGDFATSNAGNPDHHKLKVDIRQQNTIDQPWGLHTKNLQSKLS